MARDPVTRGLRDEAEVGPDPRAPRELRRLSELRYQVADGEPDVRGWKVYASTGRELGTVSDLLIDTDAGEVVMLDVDLRRGDRHTLAPIRAAWIDHATRRVVLDAREVERALAAGAAPAAGAPAAGAPAATARAEADDDTGVPALPRAGALSDDDVRRFNDDYARAYGDRGVDAERAYRLRRGDEELRFGAGRATAVGPRRLLDPEAPAAPLGAAGGAAFAESERINATLADASTAAARREAARDDVDRMAAGAPPALGARAERADAAGPVDAGERGDPSLAAAAAAADAAFARPPERRESRVDDASALDDAQGIDPRELDARVRIEEGGTVDADAPVAGVRYEAGDPAPHSYGQPRDAYGPEYGSGRIGFDKVVSRGPYTAAEDDAPADAPAPDTDAARGLRYRAYPDRYTGPGEAR